MRPPVKCFMSVVQARECINCIQNPQVDINTLAGVTLSLLKSVVIMQLLTSDVGSSPLLGKGTQ